MHPKKKNELNNDHLIKQAHHIIQFLQTYS